MHENHLSGIRKGWVDFWFGMTLEAVKKSQRSSTWVFECKIKYRKWN